MNAPVGSLAARLQALSPPGSVATLADLRAGTTPENRGGTRPATADQVHAATARKWDLTQPLPRPKGQWMSCPVCDAYRPVIRYWQFHTRPGKPTIPWRCDVSMKCTECAHLWVHGVAITKQAYDQRPAPQGLRRLLMRGSNFEPRIWAGDRRG